MKVQVFYDQDGTVQSVIRIAKGAKLKPSSREYSSITIDTEQANVRSPAELHAAFRVGARGKLERRETSKRQKPR